ncbi:MAG: hypothetical protein ACYCW6_03515 [Candidatus Xenobia bacterium]
MEQPRLEEPHDLALRFGFHAQKILGGEWNDMIEELLRVEWGHDNWLMVCDRVHNGWDLARTRGIAQPAP